MKKLLAVIIMAFALMTSVFATQQNSCPRGSFSAGDSAIAFANDVANTYGTVSDSNKAVGVDDNHYANIGSTNPDSFITLDMGAGEEVWDRFFLVDLKVFGDNSDDGFNAVKVEVSNSPTSGFQSVGNYDGDGDQDFFIGGTSYDSIRYVRISNLGGKTVEVDAVKGYCISNPTQQVPEFTTLGAFAVLGLIGLFIFKKRN